MQKEKRLLKQVATIRIEPYLAEYIIGKYGIDLRSSAVKIPYTTDLYHCVWELMSRQRSNQSEPEDGNLHLQLPFRKGKAGTNTFHNTFIAPDIIIFNLYPAGQHQSDIVDDISGMKDGLTFVIIPFLCAKTLEHNIDLFRGNIFK